MLKSFTICISYLSIIWLNLKIQKNKSGRIGKNLIKICNFEKQICFNDSKKETKFKKKVYTRKCIKINEIYAKGAWTGAGKVNISI